MIPGAHPIMSCADAMAWERDLLRGDAALEWSAMTRAGRAIGRAILRDAEEAGGLGDAGRFLALCGKGHNGADALIALHGLMDVRPRATAIVVVVPGLSALRPLVRRAFEALRRAHAARIEVVAVSGTLEGRDAGWIGGRIAGQAFDLCIDGLHSMQCQPPLRAPADWLIEALNGHPAIRIRAAVDLPSGLGGAPERAFRADFTYATGIAKSPLFSSANAGAVGRVRYLDIGFFEERVAPVTAREYVLTERVLDPVRALRASTVDKRSFGHLFIVSGSRTMPGAVLMAVEAALLSGTGLVTAFVPESLATAFAARLPEAMWVPMPETPAGGLALEGRGSVVARASRCTGLLLGPGLDREREPLMLVAELLRSIDVPTVLDAGALQLDIVPVRAAGATAPRVLTPHAGEFERITGGPDVSLRGAARALGAVIVRKGAPTRVSDGGPEYFNVSGGPVLARGGSGDVLAGLMGGLLAQGGDALQAAARAVVWHGLASDSLARTVGQSAARVTMLSNHLGQVLRERADG